MQDLEKLQDFEKVRGKFKLPLDIRPCITALLNGHNPAAKIALNPFIIACELHRVGKNKQQIESLLRKAHIKPSKLRSAVKSGVTGRWAYRCDTLEEKGLCLFESRFDCWWVSRIVGKDKKGWEEKDFWTYHWPKRLRRTEECLYRAIRAIEMRRGYQAGSRLFVSWDELYEVSRISRRTIGKKLKVLRTIGLIKYRPGEHRVRGSKGRATQVNRIIPIPRPSNSQDTV